MNDGLRPREEPLAMERAFSAVDAEAPRSRRSGTRAAARSSRNARALVAHAAGCARCAAAWSVARTLHEALPVAAAAVDREPAARAEVESAVATAPDTAPAATDSTAAPALAGAPPASEPPAGTGTWLPVLGEVLPGDLLAADPQNRGMSRRAAEQADPRVFGVATEWTRERDDGVREIFVAMAGAATVHVDAGYGAVAAGDPLVTSPTAGHAMLALQAIPGTVIGKAIDALDAGTGTGTVRVLLMSR